MARNRSLAVENAADLHGAQRLHRHAGVNKENGRNGKQRIVGESAGDLVGLEFTGDAGDHFPVAADGGNPTARTDAGWDFDRLFAIGSGESFGQSLEYEQAIPGPDDGKRAGRRNSCETKDENNCQKSTNFNKHPAPLQ